MNVNSASRLCGIVCLQWLQDQGNKRVAASSLAQPFAVLYWLLLLSITHVLFVMPGQALFCMHMELGQQWRILIQPWGTPVPPAKREVSLSRIHYNIKRWSHNYNPPTALEFENVLSPVGNFLLYKVNSVEQQLIFEKILFRQCRERS